MSNEPELLTAERFADVRWDEPDGGRWTELVEGRIVSYEPPDPVHGNVALHFSKRVAEFVQRADDCGCPAFDLGVVTARAPDTVRFPLLSWFTGVSRFAYSDEVFCEATPSLVVDVVSTPDRRRHATDRVLSFLEAGVETVWLLDAGERTAEVRSRGAAPIRFGTGETLLARSEPFTLQMPVDDLFADPEWWNG